MKTKELIEELMKADPSGECEVVAGGSPIHFVYPQPAYYDGSLHILLKDEVSHVVGFKITPKGKKIKLILLDLEDALLDDPELPVDISEVSEHNKKRTADWIETKREESRQLYFNVKKIEP